MGAMQSWALAGLAIGLGLGACGFSVGAGAISGDDAPGDAPSDDTPARDADPDSDTTPDMAMDSGPVRVTDGLVALYTLDEGTGTTIGDSVDPPVDLTIPAAPAGAATWGMGSLTISGNIVIQSAAAATKMITACKATNAASLEAWITPAASQPNGFPRVVTLSQDDNSLGLALFGIGSHYELRLRGPATDANGLPPLSTANDTMTPNALQHVVLTTAATGERHIYINGDSVASDTNGGSLASWLTTYRFVIGNETVGGNRDWRGTFHTVALYSRALSAEEVTQNFQVGPL